MLEVSPQLVRKTWGASVQLVLPNTTALSWVSFTKAGQQWCELAGWCNMHLNASYRMRNTSNAVPHWCPDLITRSVIVLPATEGTSLSKILGVASYYSYVVYLMMSKKHLDNKSICYLEKIEVVFFVLSLKLMLRTLVFNENDLGQTAVCPLGSNSRSGCSASQTCQAA